MSRPYQEQPRKGTRRSFPKHRQTVLDIIHESQRIPSFPLTRTMKLGKLAHARDKSSSRVSWTTLFGKAYSLVCSEISELRELYVHYPFKQLYCHPHSVASISIHRRDDLGNERLIWGRWSNAESLPLLELQRQLDTFCNAPMDEAYREGMILERQPAIARRLAWWWIMNWSGRKRAKHIGTFSISSLGGQGALNAHHPLITTSSLAFGPIGENGECEVALICDHRTLDGMLGARALQKLESVLCTQIAMELHATYQRAAG